MPRKMFTTSCAKPFTTSEIALPAFSTSLEICCPTGVHRNTKRLPAANAAALAGSDGTATINAGSAAGAGTDVVDIRFSSISIRRFRGQRIQGGLDLGEHSFYVRKLLVGGFRLRSLRQIRALDHPTAGLIEQRSRQVH